jgi:glutathione S-transferase
MNTTCLCRVLDETAPEMRVVPALPPSRASRAAVEIPQQALTAVGPLIQTQIRPRNRPQQRPHRRHSTRFTNTDQWSRQYLITTHRGCRVLDPHFAKAIIHPPPASDLWIEVTRTVFVH